MKISIASLSVLLSLAGVGPLSASAIPNDTLPEGYARIAYVESTGAQYIDTGIVPTENTRTDIGYEYLANQSDGQTMIAGKRDGEIYPSRYYPVSLNGSPTQERYVFGNTIPSRSFGALARHEIVFNDEDHRVFVDGALVYTFDTNDYVTGELSLWLFAANSSTAAHWFSRARIYHCEIYTNGVPARAFVPCIDNATGAAGFYDTVEGRFFGNEGSGKFVAGTSLLVTRNADGTVDAQFPPADHARRMEFVYGNEDHASGAGWDAVEAGPEIAPGATSVTGVPLPAGFGADANLLRVALVSPLADSGVSLPAGYRRVECLESTGVQHVETDIVPDADTRVEIGYQYMAYGGSLTVIGAASITGGDGLSRFYPVSVQNIEQKQERHVLGAQTLVRAYSEGPHELVFNDANHKVWVDGSSVGTFNVSNYTGTDHSLWIFGVNSAAPTHYCASAKVWHCEIYTNGILARAFVPGLDAWGTAGFWDRVEGRFLANDVPGSPLLQSTVLCSELLVAPSAAPPRVVQVTKGGGGAVSVELAFGASEWIRPLFCACAQKDCGAEPSAWTTNQLTKLEYVPPYVTRMTVDLPAELAGRYLNGEGLRFFVERNVLPAGLRPVSYIQSEPSGGQFVDTGIVPTSATRTDVGYTYLGTVSGSGGLDVVAGVRQSGSGTTRYYPVSLNGNKWAIRHVLSSAQLYSSHMPGVRQEAVFNDERHGVTVDGEDHGAFTESAVSSFNSSTGRTIWLFGTNSESSDLTQNHWYAYARIYHCEIYTNGVPARAFVPCVTRDGQGCLYDLVGHNVYTNAGSGMLLGGGQGPALLQNGLPVCADATEFVRRPSGCVVIFR